MGVQQKSRISTRKVQNAPYRIPLESLECMVRNFLGKNALLMIRKG